MAAPRSAKAAGDCARAGWRFREMGRAKEGGEMMGNDAPNDADVNRMMAVFDKLLRQTNVAKDEMAMSVNSFVGRAQDIIAAKIAENTQLRAQVAERDALIAEVTKTLGGYPDSDLLSLARTVAIGYQQWSDGHDAMTDNLRAQLAERGMELVIKEMRIDSLTAALDDVRNRWHDAEQDWMQLRAQVATLTERLSRCTCTDDYGNEAP